MQQTFEILEKQILVPEVFKMVISAPLVAAKAKPGEFVIIRSHEHGERIPLTIADFCREKGTITIVVQEVGLSTRYLGRMTVGERLLDFAGPLGKPTHIRQCGTVVCVGGGIGVAPIYPIARGMKEAGNKVISIIGARNKSMVILQEEMQAVSDRLFVTTDDGTLGEKGLVTDKLKQLIESELRIDEVVAIGPVVMMRAVAEVTRPYGIKTIVSLNPIMVDGTGMCGGCRVSVGSETFFACVDGPEFDGHKVDFAELESRRRSYLFQEKAGKEQVHHSGGGCRCKC